jgi:hypothetical protein
MQYWNIPKYLVAQEFFLLHSGLAPKIFDDIKAKGKKVNAKIYFYAVMQKENPWCQ